MEPTMEFAPLGRTGINVSRICLGTALFGLAPLEKDVPSLIDRALDLGINFFDTANTYGNRPAFDRPGMPAHTERKSGEELLGTALKGNRHDVIIASKVGEKRYDGQNGLGLSRQHIMRAIDDTLRRLQTDYLLLLYTNDLEIEALIASAGSLVNIARKKNILDVLDVYEQVQPNLARHDPRYPTADALRAITWQGLDGTWGSPFFYMGDTAWELFHRLNRDEAQHYLSNRAAKGFTVIQAVALAELGGRMFPTRMVNSR